MGVNFLVPFFQALDNNGDPLDGAKLYAYEAGTTTPLDLFNDAGLQNPTDHPLRSDANGRFSQFFLDSRKYKLVLTDSNDNEIDTVDHYLAEDSSISSIADLKAYAGSQTFIYVSGHTTVGDGGGGWFRWDATSTATADDATVVEKTGHTGAGRWIRVHDGCLIPEMFGAFGDNVTDVGTEWVMGANKARELGIPYVGRKDKIYYLGSTSGYQFTTVGTYDIRDMVCRGNDGILHDSELLHFNGPQRDSQANLVSSTTIGDTSVVINSSDATNYVVGAKVIIASDKTYHTASAAQNAKVSEFVRVKSVDADTPSAGQTTITFKKALQSSYATSDTARIFRAQETMIVKMRNCRFYLNTPMADDNNHRAYGIRIDAALVDFKDVEVDGWNDSGIFCNVCYEPVLTDCVGRNAFLSGTGYALNIAGCDQPKITRPRGYNVRHICPFGAGTSPDNFLGRGGYAVHQGGKGITNAGLDVHPGHVGARISGDFDCDGNSESLASIQGCDITIDYIGADGARGSGIAIQNFGRPADEGPNVINIGNVDAGYNPSTNYIVQCQSYDTTDTTDLVVNCGRIAGDWASALLVEDNGGSDRGGNIFATYEFAGAKRDGHGVFVDNRSKYRRLKAVGQTTVMNDDNASYYIGYVYHAQPSPDIAETLTLSSSSVGTGVTATAGGDIFRDDFVGGSIQELTGSGVATITGYTSATVATIEITTAFSGTSISANDWEISPPWTGAELVMIDGESNAPTGTTHARSIDGRIDFGARFGLFGGGAKSIKSGAGGVFQDGTGI